MAFKDLHKLKKIAVVEKENINVAHLVVGKDIFALSLYKVLVEKHGKDNVRLLSEDTVLKSDLWVKGPGSIRGSANQKVVEELYPEAVVKKFEENAIFYKDMTWKSFGGRSKPEALKFNEEFYTSSRFDIDPTKIFPELENTESFLEEINSSAYQVRVKAIRREGEGFIVECINGTEFSCEKLYFGQSPYQYLNFYTNKNELSDHFIEFCEGTKSPSALFVKYVLEKPVSDIMETMFIPLSYTHEWGHYIGEFKDVSDSQSGPTHAQEIEFIHFVDEDHVSEEDVSRIIRSLKKNMEKIFEKFSKIKSQEFISLESEIGCLKIDDELFFKSLVGAKAEVSNLFFLGINAPIVDTQSEKAMFEYSKNEINILSRALLVHHFLLKKI
jgi:hypothetical protein